MADSAWPRRAAPATDAAGPAARLPPQDERQCWICFSTDQETEPGDVWVHPCRCKGDTKWVHERCLLQWVDEKQAHDALLGTVRCPQCQHPYRIVVPLQSVVFGVATRLNAGINVVFPYVALSGLAYCGYISCVTYGFYAVAQLLGPARADELLINEQWGWRLYVGLPLIPISLMMARAQAFDAFLPVMPLLVLHPTIELSYPPSPATIVAFLPWLRMAYGAVLRAVQRRVLGSLPDERPPVAGLARQPSLVLEAQLQAGGTEDGRAAAGHAGAVIPPSPTPAAVPIGVAAHHPMGNQAGHPAVVGHRVVLIHPLRRMLGALLLPAMASLVGRVFLRHWFDDTFRRNIVGGCLVVLVKDAISLAYEFGKARYRHGRHVHSYDGD